MSEEGGPLFDPGASPPSVPRDAVKIEWPTLVEQLAGIEAKLDALAREVEGIRAGLVRRGSL